MRWLILLLLRKELRLKKYQLFQFKGQKNKDNYYYFNDSSLVKLHRDGGESSSNVSLNWLLNSNSDLIKTDKYAM